MTVGAFELVNQGLIGHQNGAIDVENGTFYAILTTHGGGTPDVVNDDIYSDISAQEHPATGNYAPVDVGLTVDEVSPGVARVAQDAPADFGAGNATISARYYWVLEGDEASPQVGDRILGVMDLRTEDDGDEDSVNSDFKVTAGAGGLYQTSKA